MSFTKFKAAAKALGKPMAQKVDELKVDYKVNTTVISEQTTTKSLEQSARRLVELTHDYNTAEVNKDKAHLSPQVYLDKAIAEHAKDLAEAEAKKLTRDLEQVAAGQRIVQERIKLLAEQQIKAEQSKSAPQVPTAGERIPTS